MKATGFAWKHSFLMFFDLFRLDRELESEALMDYKFLWSIVLIICVMGLEVQHDWLLVKDVDLNLVARAMGEMG